MSRFTVWLMCACTFVALALGARAQGSKPYENEEFGYRVKPPKEWTQIPLQASEKWQTAKWLCNRAYFFTEPGGGWTYEHKPELVVLAFATQDARKRAEVEKKEDKNKNVVILIESPYKDYLDYFKRTNNDGGFYVSGEKQIDVKGHRVTCYEIKIEKLTRTGPKRVITWVHHTTFVDYAVQIDVLEDSYDKLKKEVAETQKSFELTTESGRLGGAASTGERTEIPIEDVKLTPEQRKSRRIDIEKTAHRKAKATLTDGWSSMQVGRFLILNHSDAKFAQRVGEQAEAVFKWCEATFPFVGPGEYVRQPVIRICANDDEERSFFGGGSFFFFGDRMPEIVMHNDQTGFVTSYEVDYLNRAIFALWFQDRDRELWFAMPGWLGGGLTQLVAKSRLDKGKLDFRSDAYGRDRLRELIRAGNGTKPRELVKMTASDYVGTDVDQWATSHYQSGALVRHLAVGEGAKSSKSKDVLRNYIKALRLVVTEIEAADEAKTPSDASKPKTEEEEEAYFKNKNQEWKKKEQEVLDATFERCFHGWSNSDWAAFEKSYFENV